MLHKICNAADLPPGQRKAFWVEGRSIALFNVGGTFHATENECTHEEGPLDEGELRGQRIICPWHGAEFDVTTGEALTAPAACAVETFPVVVESGEVKVELP